MDTWDLETLLVMAELGNTAVNSVYEGQLPAGMTKPTAEADAYEAQRSPEVKKHPCSCLESLDEVSSKTSTFGKHFYGRSSPPIRFVHRPVPSNDGL